jgi:3-methyladenine DNA glycosylase AlkD
MSKPNVLRKIEEMDDEVADLERQLKEARARLEIEDAKAMELCDQVMEDVKRQLGEDSELYLEMLFAGLETEGGCH